MAGMQELRRLQSRERAQLSLVASPLLTARYFALAISEQVAGLCAYLSRSRAAFYSLLAALWLLSILIALDRPSVGVVHEILAYGRFAAWWMALGIASSVGFGSGLHTFVLYLAPHVARFTLKATACGRTDLKSAPYDTLQWGAADLWGARPCLDFGPPLFEHHASEHAGGAGYYMVPLTSVMVQVLPEAVLWGLGTAVGELPPYLVARTARLSGERVRELKDLGVDTDVGAADTDGVVDDADQVADSNPPGEGKSAAVSPPSPSQRVSFLEPGAWVQVRLRQLTLWLLSGRHQFSFFTIVFLAAIPNPLFDFAGVTCGHFLVPMWKFFAATLVGKALLKAPLQAGMVVVLFNAHTVDVLETVLERLLQHVPVLNRLLPRVLAALDAMRQRVADGANSSSNQEQRKSFSLAAAWSAFVGVMFCGFLGSMVSAIARNHLILLQQRDLQQARALLEQERPPQQGVAAAEGELKGKWHRGRRLGQAEGEGEVHDGVHNAEYDDDEDRKSSVETS